ncbi:MAG: nickel-dependent lactate racemase [Planctomycetaceae bacterium]|nr:nickel-dependent lactate racemase [Planctomycetaceae bacterium]
MDISLGLGKEKVAVTLDDASVAAVITPNPVEMAGEPEKLVADALMNPIASPRLRDIAKPGEKVVIVTSDITRPMPSKVVLPFILDELTAAGVPDGDIEIVFGLGIHRGHTEEEKRALVGDAVYERVKCTDSDPENIVRVGKTEKNGTPVDVFTTVAQADRRICLGNIEYHYFAGYSGGGKAIMPGVCSRDSIQANHSQMVRDGSRAGQIDGNPVREDIDAAAAMVGIDFILNVVLDEKKRIVCAVAGDYIQAHRAGAKFLDSLYKVEIDQPADIVLVSSGGFPKDINLYQAQKALDNAKNAVRDGGVVILVASCKEGLGEDVFERWMVGAEKSAQMIDDIQKNFELGGHKAAAIAMVLERADVYLVSDMPADFVESIFFKPFPDVDAALAAARAKLGCDARVIVMPYGGSTLPSVGT